MIWVNFKLYRQTFAEGALKLADMCRQVSLRSKVKIIPVVTPFDLREIKGKVGGEVWLQHVDAFPEGQETGWVSPLQAKAAGADGTLINHSEHKISPGKIRQTLSLVESEKGFAAMICFRSQGQATGWLKRIRNLHGFVAYEPPELIGGEISVSQARPEVIKRVVDLLPEKKIVVGAGIKRAADIAKALKLGATGVLVSSAVVTAVEPKKVLSELVKPFGEVKLSP